ncbi:MAG TPA: hypothetical protein VGI26_00345 [Solirubrobacteraceae bacterium]|jgi:hypothetical protein
MSAHDFEDTLDSNVPQPDSERGAWVAAITLGLLGVAVLALALSGLVGGSQTSVAPPPVLAVTPTPVAQVTPTTTATTRIESPTRVNHRAIVNDPSTEEAHRDFAAFEAQTGTHIGERWMQSFYPIYATAQKTFGVNWLLIASIHKQETAFSTAPSTYRGLNFAGCCGGPMQFNVTNGGAQGSGSTWALMASSYRYAKRPNSYGHRTVKHPSIYDDFDSIMAGAHLLASDGAGSALDDSAWNAAYDYYGHDPTGVTYADQVLARAIGWSQHGFCINCGIETSLVEAVNAAYGAPVAASFEAAKTAAVKPRHRKH